MLDGWLICQKNKSSAANDKRDAESLLTNEKIKNSQEVYMKVDTAKDAKKIEALNDKLAARIKKSRLDHLKKVGEVSEWNMPDTKQDIMMEFNNPLRGILVIALIFGGSFMIGWLLGRLTNP